MNRPERYEAIYLEDDEEKITWSKDTKMTDAATFTINKEDHTVGNVLRMHLLENKKVLFAGYKLPHPLYYDIKVKVRTTPDTDPVKEFKGSLRQLQKTFVDMKKKFKRAVEEKKQSDDVSFT